MKRIFILTLILTILSSCACADNRKIYCEIENKNAVTYFTTHLSQPIKKIFVKYIDNNNNTSYWFRISNNSANRFMYYMDIEFDGQKYTLEEIQTPTYSQIKSTTGFEAQNTLQTFSLYKIPQNIIDNLKDSKTPIIFTVNRQKRQGMKFNSDIEFTQAIQKIISLNYSNKDEYWNPNI